MGCSPLFPVSPRRRIPGQQRASSSPPLLLLLLLSSSSSSPPPPPPSRRSDTPGESMVPTPQHGRPARSSLPPPRGPLSPSTPLILYRQPPPPPPPSPPWSTRHRKSGGRKGSSSPEEGWSKLLQLMATVALAEIHHVILGADFWNSQRISPRLTNSEHLLLSKSCSGTS
ncbi:uncharacterized protein LOC144322288 [Canis aureus]